ncbi:MAG TPA: PHB depolymerase family esterase [Polyangiaceae bacterium]|jgi:polyhydroxybutyrate depolymerase
MTRRVPLLLLLTACGSSASGTVHESPPLPPVDGPDASTLPGASTGSGGSSSSSSGGAPSAGDDASAPAPVTTAPVSCSGKTGAPGDLTLTLTSGGYARDSLLHVPASYDPTKGTMLVVNYHGYSSNAAEQVALTGMNPVADATNFIVAYPDGLGAGWNAGDCCTETQPPNVDDVQFTKDLLSLIESEYCIDPARIYATGMSNGGFMSHYLACTMADTFAAVAPVAGVLGVDPTTCQPSRPIPIEDFHGTGDDVVPYNGGSPAQLLPEIDFRSVPSTVTFWRGADACLGDGVVTYQKGTATCVEYSDCGGVAQVELCTLVGEGHEWPGGLPVPTLGASTDDVIATTRMVAFFLAHPMP